VGHENATDFAAGSDVEAIDAILQNKYARQPEELHVWQTISGIHRAQSKKKQSTGGNPPPPTP
jgi:hypothetical protein